MLIFIAIEKYSEYNEVDINILFEGDNYNSTKTIIRGI
jgi:hypothetical protein